MWKKVVILGQKFSSETGQRLLVGLALLALLLPLAGYNSKSETTERLGMKQIELTPEETRVIVHKGTEPAFSGKYDRHFETGDYTCKRCAAPLFHSDDKFNSGCGWPAFDDAIEGAVEEIPDADGQRTEIVCAGCKAHLGHVFRGEHLTEQNLRHCVNSLSLEFIPGREQTATTTATAYFAGGCFWGTDYFLQKADGVLSTRSGYMGGETESPSYREVCSGTTGHTETVEVVFDPRLTDYETLARLFFEIHDPTQINRQGPDVGSQYRSAVFYTDEAQKKSAAELIATLRNNEYQVATELVPASAFWPAEEYHQDYYLKNGQAPYCHSPVDRF